MVDVHLLQLRMAGDDALAAASQLEEESSSGACAARGAMSHTPNRPLASNKSS